MSRLEGQWLGRVTGTNNGSVALNIDKREGRYVGMAYHWDDDPQLVSYAMNVSLHLEGDAVSGTATPFAPIDIHRGGFGSWPDLLARHPNIRVSNSVSLEGSLAGDKMTIQWSTEIETAGEAKLYAGAAGEESRYDTTQQTWHEFRDYALSLQDGKYIFRGQSNSWRLRTAFHRNGRFDLSYYSVNDVQHLARYFCAISGHVFNLDSPREHGALLSLAQHHGYPTPLLDWTASPFIAAFFAFVEAEQVSTGNVRILILDRDSWSTETPFAKDINWPELSLSIFEMTPIRNDRMIPQQSVTTFSNVDDIESFIQWHENKRGKNYLTIVELPAAERGVALTELRKMGISYGSLFPGLDGTCRDLRERFF